MEKHQSIDRLGSRVEIGRPGQCGRRISDLRVGVGALVVPADECVPLSLATLQRPGRDGSVFASGTEHSSRKSRTIPAELRRALQFRDGGCRYPGCTNTRYVEAHHVVHRARGGATTLENLVLLCRRHHTYVHEWGFRVEAGSGPGHFRFFNRRGVEIQTELIEFSD